MARHELTSFEWAQQGRMLLGVPAVAYLVNPEDETQALGLFTIDQTAEKRPEDWVRVSAEDREQWKAERKKERARAVTRNRSRTMIDKAIAYRRAELEKITAAGGDDGKCVAIATKTKRRCTVKHMSGVELCRNHQRLSDGNRHVETLYDDPVPS